MIEDTLQKLTASIDALTAAITRQGCTPALLDEVRITGVERKQVMENLPPVDKPAEKAPKAEKAEKAPKAEKPAPKAEKTEEPKAGATLADVRDAAQKCLDGGKLAAVVALNKEYGLKRISEAPEDKFGEIVAKLNAALNES